MHTGNEKRTDNGKHSYEKQDSGKHSQSAKECDQLFVTCEYGQCKQRENMEYDQ